EAEQRAGQHTRTACSRCCDDHSHRSVHFLHCECCGQRGYEGSSGQWTVAGRELGGVPTNQSGNRTQVSLESALDGIAHHVERSMQVRLYFLARAKSRLRLAPDREFTERNAVALRCFDCLEDAVEHQVTRSTTRTVFT